MVTDRMCIIRYENGTHDTEKKRNKKFFFGATIFTMQFRNFILRFC